MYCDADHTHTAYRIMRSSKLYIYMLPRPIFHYFIVLYLLHIYYLHKSTATWRFFTISNLLGTGQIPRKIQAFGPKEKKLVVKDKCVHKSENQPGRVSRVWWRGRDSWMDRWTIWYLDGVTVYLDSYRYLYWECVALVQWYCYNQGDDDITLYRVIRLSQYRICTTNTCLYDDDLHVLQATQIIAYIYLF